MLTLVIENHENLYEEYSSNAPQVGIEYLFRWSSDHNSKSHKSSLFHLG